MQSSTNVLSQFQSRDGALKNCALDAGGDLFASVYPELRRMAARQMQAERKSHTLQTTALVHEAFLRIARGREDCRERLHFFALASQTMRHVLVDHARARMARKRDCACGEEPFNSFSEVVDSARFIDLHEALSRLASVDQRQAQIVEMRFFGGCTEEEIALAFGVSTRTVKRDWALARVWLYGELND